MTTIPPTPTPVDGRRRMPRPARRVAVALAISLLVAGCSGGSEPEPTTTTTTTRPTTTTTEPQPRGPGIEGAAPLTGLESDVDLTDRPVVAVKIGNTAGKATPQIGINQADVVYELQIEAQVTRFLALFHSQDAEPVGPVRSARLSEIPLLEALDKPIFVWHGANDIIRPQVRNSAIVNGSIDDVSSVFYRDRERPGPYNSFAEGTTQIRALKSEGAGTPKPLFYYRISDAGMAPSAVPAKAVHINFAPPLGRGGGEAPVDYVWDAGDEVWRRSQLGLPHVDSAGVQVAVENVIVQFAEYRDSGMVDKSGTRVPTAQLIGEGEAWVFTGGKLIKGTWGKPDGVTPTRFLDADGNDIRLAPGRTWITIPAGTNITVDS